MKVKNDLHCLLGLQHVPIRELWFVQVTELFSFGFQTYNINRQVKSGSLKQSAAHTTRLLKTCLG